MKNPIIVTNNRMDGWRIFDSQAWYHWEYTNELDMNMKNDQLLKDGNVHEEKSSSKDVDGLSAVKF